MTIPVQFPPVEALELSPEQAAILTLLDMVKEQARDLDALRKRVVDLERGIPRVGVPL